MYVINAYMYIRVHTFAFVYIHAHTHTHMQTYMYHHVSIEMYSENFSTKNMAGKSSDFETTY